MIWLLSILRLTHKSKRRASSDNQCTANDWIGTFQRKQRFVLSIILEHYDIIIDINTTIIKSHKSLTSDSYIQLSEVIHAALDTLPCPNSGICLSTSMWSSWPTPCCPSLACRTSLVESCWAPSQYLRCRTLWVEWPWRGWTVFRGSSLWKGLYRREWRWAIICHGKAFLHPI